MGIDVGHQVNIDGEMLRRTVQTIQIMFKKASVAIPDQGVLLLGFGASFIVKGFKFSSPESYKIGHQIIDDGAVGAADMAKFFFRADRSVTREVFLGTSLILVSF